MQRKVSSDAVLYGFKPSRILF